MKLRDVYLKADLAIRLGSTDYASQLCEFVLEKFTADLRARTLLGQAELERGRLDYARQHFDLVLELDPESVLALSAVGVVNSAAGQLNAAVRAFERAYELNPNNGEVRDSLLQLYAQRDGSPKELPDAPSIAVLRWHLRHGDLDRALDAASQMLVTRPGDVYVLLARAEALWRAGGAGDAERACRQILARHPRFLKPRLIAAMIAAADVSRELEGVDTLRTISVEDPSGSVATALFHGTSIELPVLAEDLDLDLPEHLARGPSEVEAAVGVFPLTSAEEADNEWAPPAESTETPLVAAAKLATRPDDSAAISIAAPARATVSAPSDTRRTSGRQATVVRDFTEHVASTQLLVVSCRDPLIARYGFEGFQRLERRLQTVARELADFDTSIVVSFVDDPASMGQFSLQAIHGNDPVRIKQAIDDVVGAAFPLEKVPSGILLLGGDDVVPFFHLPNPADDDDPAVPSDNPYGMRAGDLVYAPEIPIGRLPDGSSGNMSLLLRQIDTWLEVRRKPQLVSSGTGIMRASRLALDAFGLGRTNALAAGCTAAPWRQSAEHVFAPLGPASSLRLSPPALADDFDARWFAGRRILYFNLIGAADGPTWYGESDGAADPDLPLLPIALTPDQLAAADLNAPVVLCEACYGSHIFSKSSSNSLALRFLSEGAAAFIGSTVATYGANGPVLDAADLLAHLFWHNVRGGDSLGLALQRAKSTYVQTALERQGYLDGDDQKTLLAFGLFGDPLQSLYPVEGAANAMKRPSDITLLCNQSGTTVSARSVSPQLLRTAIEQIGAECSIVADGSIRIHQRPGCAGGCGHSGHQSSGSEASVTTVTARKEIPTPDGTHIVKVARATVAPNGEIAKIVVSR